jgi:hypothetical protein
MCCTAQNQSKTFFFVCEWLLQDRRPTNHVPTPLAFHRADTRAHLGAATCLRPADATPPWGRLYKSRSLGPASPGPRASSVLSSAFRPPSSARVPARRGGGGTTRQRPRRTKSNTSLVSIFPSQASHASASEQCQRPRHRAGITNGPDRAVGNVALAGCRLQMAAGPGEGNHASSVDMGTDMDGGSDGNTREGMRGDEWGMMGGRMGGWSPAWPPESAAMKSAGRAAGGKIRTTKHVTSPNAWLPAAATQTPEPATIG